MGAVQVKHTMKECNQNSLLIKIQTRNRSNPGVSGSTTHKSKQIADKEPGENTDFKY